MKTLLLGILLGVTIVKGTYEYSNVRQVKNYEECVQKAIAQPDYKANALSGYQQCRHHLRANAVESVVLWQPNLWCKYDALHCEDRD